MIAREGKLSGRLSDLEFLGRIWDLTAMPSHDSRFENAYQDIWQHRVNNEDWDDHYLLYDRLNMLHCADEVFFRFLENCLHPIIVILDADRTELLTVFNDILARDNFTLRETAFISGKPVFKVMPLRGGVRGAVKNLIFAANGPKPEIVLIDSLNNDIQIVQNEQYCLVYERPIGEQGLLWQDLVDWWVQLQDMNSRTKKEQENSLYQRLSASLSSPPERLLFRTYYHNFPKELKAHLPALIPQVYLHYDPKTIKELSAGQRLARQRMDFLLLFSPHDRIVIEVDGEQHYSLDRVAKPELYAKMVAEDRRLRLAGYQIYRFGGYELQNGAGEKIIIDFFWKLFRLHGLKT
jgi:AbiJ N-terminal domain 3